MVDYYKRVKEPVHTKFCACELMINWEVPSISGDKNASGFIVQRFSRKLIPTDVLKTPEYSDIAYYEAWRVKNGVIDTEDAGVLCNDMFSIGNSLIYFSEFTRSIDTKGKFSFSGKVYWIPDNSELYDLIDAWSRKTVKQACGLRASYECKELDGIQPLFVRDDFIHEWDLTDEKTLYSVAKDMLFGYCPTNTKRDRELLISNVYDLLTDKYRNLADKIIEEWENQWR